MKHSNLQNAKTVIKNNFLYYYIIYNYNIIMSISSTGIYGNRSILNSEIYTDIINDIEGVRNPVSARHTYMACGDLVQRHKYTIECPVQRFSSTTLNPKHGSVLPEPKWFTDEERERESETESKRERERERERERLKCTPEGCKKWRASKAL